MAATIFDYIGRSYDFLAFQNVKERGDSLLELALFSDQTSGQICTGPQKLAQRWLLEFLTETGSMPGLPERGTDFMLMVRQGRLRTYASIWNEFGFSSYVAGVNLRKEENDTWSPDERFKSAQLINLAVLPGYANLSIEIRSLAEGARQIVLPIQTLPQNIADG